MSTQEQDRGSIRPLTYTAAPAAVLHLFRQGIPEGRDGVGLSTHEIAYRLRITEAEAYRLLDSARELEHAAKRTAA